MQLLLAPTTDVGRADRRRAQAHAATCPDCASALDDPGAAERALAALGSIRPAPAPVLRAALAGLSAGQLALAALWLFGASPIGDHVEASHLTRDGALGLAIATAGAVAAWRPRYAVACLAMSMTAVVAQVAAIVVDEHAHRVYFAHELVHAVVLVIIALVALSGRAPRAAAAPRPPSLEAV